MRCRCSNVVFMQGYTWMERRIRDPKEMETYDMIICSPWMIQIDILSFIRARRTCRLSQHKAEIELPHARTNTSCGLHLEIRANGNCKRMQNASVQFYSVYPQSRPQQQERPQKQRSSMDPSVTRTRVSCAGQFIHYFSSCFYFAKFISFSFYFPSSFNT